MKYLLEDIENIYGEGICVSSYKDEWEFTCPECLVNKRLHISLDTGLFICVTPGCGYKGKLSSPTYVVNTPPITVNKNLLYSVYTWMMLMLPIREFHSNWLLSRGLNPSMLKCFSTDNALSKLRIKFTNDELLQCGLVKKDGLKYYATPVLSENRICLCYVHPISQQCIYIRSRFAGRDAFIRYASPSGVPLPEYCFGWETLQKNNTSVIITEGELDAQILKQEGFNAIGLPGIGVMHNELAICLPKHNIKTVYTIFDNDNSTSELGIPKNTEVIKHSSRLKALLNRVGIKVHTVNLPNISNKKTDVNNYYLSNKTDFKNKIIELIKLSK